MDNLLKGNPPRWQKYLFWLHTLVFGFASMLMILHGLGFPGQLAAQPFAAMLIWSLIYVVHRSGYISAKVRAEVSGDNRRPDSEAERRVYREGFRDGLREAMTLQTQGRSPDQLMIDDDGELLEQLHGEKAKRRDFSLNGKEECTMKEKSKRYPISSARMAMLAHSIMYGVGWAFAFLTIVSPLTARYFPSLFMIWTLFYLLHLVFYNRSMNSTAAGTVDERRIYREAYHDAMQQIRREQDDDRRLMMPDEGELSDLYAAEKMKRRE